MTEGPHHPPRRPRSTPSCQFERPEGTVSESNHKGIAQVTTSSGETGIRARLKQCTAGSCSVREVGPIDPRPTGNMPLSGAAAGQAPGANCTRALWQAPCSPVASRGCCGLAAKVYTAPGSVLPGGPRKVVGHVVPAMGFLFQVMRKRCEIEKKSHRMC